MFLPFAAGRRERVRKPDSCLLQSIGGPEFAVGRETLNRHVWHKYNNSCRLAFDPLPGDPGSRTAVAGKTPVTFLVIMGVAGSGKSTLARLLADRLGVAMIEGDEFHSAGSIAKMRAAIPLDDADREAWLESLCAQLRSHERGAVLSCSALKRRYREQLRAARSPLHFVFLDIDRESARARVAARVAAHPFPAALIDSQFVALEAPLAEPHTLRIAALQPPAALSGQVLAWLASA